MRAALSHGLGVLLFVGGSSLAVFEDSDNKDAAWAFVEFLTHPEVQATWYEQQYLAIIGPRLIEQGRGHAGGLARTGRCHQQRPRSVAQRLEQLRQDGIDRKPGGHGPPMGTGHDKRNRLGAVRRKPAPSGRSWGHPSNCAIQRRWRTGWCR